MSNVVTGLIEVEVSDGRTIKLLFDFNTFVDAEEATGLDVNELVEGLKNRTLSARRQRAFFWCALREHQPEMTEREAGRLLVELADGLQKAMEAALPEAEEAGEEAGAHPPRPAGTGTSS